MFKFTPHAIQSAVVATTLALSAFSLNAQATLTSYTNGGVDLVYSSVSDVTWTKDANLYTTLANSDPNFSQTMRTIAASNGLSVGAEGTDAYWTTAYVFTLYLNSINYGGSNQWRLPTKVTRGGNLKAGNGVTAGDELIELFYQELNGTYGNPIPNTATFDNEQNAIYWLGTETNATNALYMDLSSGSNNDRGQAKRQGAFVWAVTSGRINPTTPSAVPVPAAAWLFGSGLLGLVGLRRRKQVV